MTETLTVFSYSDQVLDRDWSTVDDTLIFPVQTCAPRPVSGDLVHKNEVDQIFVTGGSSVADLRFLVDLAWPSVHEFYRPDESAGYDSVLIGESLRQATYYVSHRFCDVPSFWSFILGDLEWQVEDFAPFRRSGAFVELGVEITCTRVANWTRLRRSFRVDAVFRFGGRVCATGSLLAEAVEPRIYQKLRRRTGPAESVGTVGTTSVRRPAPSRVGRQRDTDVVIGECVTPGVWPIAADQAHRVMFDHSVDHLPGMLLFEAGRQAGFLSTETILGRRAETLLGAQLRFAGFCELDQDTAVHTACQEFSSRDNVARIAVRIVQCGKDTASGVFDYALGSGPGR